jgi:hypothetical protein
VGRISLNKRFVLIRVLHSPLLIEISSSKFRVFKPKIKHPFLKKSFAIQGLEKEKSPIKKL